MYFDGVDDRVNIPDSNQLRISNGVSDSAFEVEVEVFLSSLVGVSPLVAKDSSLTLFDWAFFCVGSSIRFIIGSAINSSVNYIGANAIGLTVGKSVVKATYDGSGAYSGIKIYLNGVELVTTNISTGSYSNGSVGADVSIGRRLAFSTQRIRGIISNVLITKNGTAVFNGNGNGNSDYDWRDTSGSGNNPTVIGSPSNTYIPRDESDTSNDVFGNPLEQSGTRPNDAALINSSCLDLNGTNQAVRVADNTALDITDNLTVCVWGKNNESNIVDNQYIFAKYDTTGNNREWGILFEPTSDNFNVNFGDQFAGTFSGRVSSDVIPALNIWNHYVFSFSSGTVKMYINGVSTVVSLASGVIPTSLFNGSSDLVIGAILSSPSLASLWDGQIFDARIYAGDSTVLTAAQILSIYEDGINNVEFAGQSLRAHYVCAEGAGAGVLDYSGAGNDGTIENAVTNWGVTQDVLHFNLLEGFSLYEHASSDPIRVKFINGSARSFTPPTGYTLTGHYPAGSDLIPAETEINFNPDSTPEMGSTQLSFTVPAAHKFGDVLPSYYKMFSRKTDTSEDRFIVFKDALYNTDLTRIRQYTGKTAYPLDNFKDSIIGAWSTRRLFSDLPTPSYLLNGRDGTTNTLDFAEPELSGGILSLANGGNAFCPNLYDQSGNGNHATQVGAASQPKLVDAGSLITDASGRPVMEFDGAQSSLIAPDAASLSATTALTVSVWAKNNASTLSSGEYLINKYDFLNNNREYSLSIDSASNQVKISLGQSGGLLAAIWLSTSGVTIQNWNLYTFVFAPSSLSVYLNGATLAGAVSAGALPAALGDRGSDLAIGCRITTGSARTDFWNGGLNDAIILNKSLTSGEVASLYNALL